MFPAPECCCCIGAGGVCCDNICARLQVLLVQGLHHRHSLTIELLKRTFMSTSNKLGTHSAIQNYNLASQKLLQIHIL